MRQKCFRHSAVGNGVVNPQSEFAMKLSSAGLTQKQFRDLVRRLSGRTIDSTTTSRWAAGGTAPPCAISLLRLVSLLQPAHLAELLKEIPPNP